MSPDHPMRERLVLLLAEGWGAVHIAGELAVDRRTVWVWSRDPGVQEAAAAEREKLLAETRERGRGAIALALDALIFNLNDKDGSVRNAAANSLLDRFGVPKSTKVESEVKDSRAPEVDRARLLLELEAKAQGGQNGDP